MTHSQYLQFMAQRAALIDVAIAHHRAMWDAFNAHVAYSEIESRRTYNPASVPAARFTIHAMSAGVSMACAEGETLGQAVRAVRALSSALYPKTWHNFYLIAEGSK